MLAGENISSNAFITGNKIGIKRQLSAKGICHAGRIGEIVFEAGTRPATRQTVCVQIRKRRESRIQSWLGPYIILVIIMILS